MKYFFTLFLISFLWAGDASLNKENLGDTKDQPIASANKSTAEIATGNMKILILLQRLESILKEKADVTFPEFSPTKALRSGDKDDSILILRQILQALGYLEKVTDSPFFDMELEKAVKAFQAGHCLETDGVISDEMKEKINWPFAKRLQMVKDSIEKIKRLLLSDSAVIVNIPTYSLYAYDKQKLVMSMKAIVGSSAHPTSLITSYIDDVEFNPVWIVPHTVLFEDELPKIQEDSEFFRKNDMKVFDRNGHEVNPTEVDWTDVDVNDFPYVFKQNPGKENELGLIKFNLRDNQEIYMHDTSHQESFKKHMRALSSGCIRIEQPGKLASWLLGMDKDEVKSELDIGDTKTKKLKAPLIVYITYIPVWIDEEFGDGKVLWGDDPYKLQPKPFH
jgi:murein L,D-transpeptidase YcbB/YkuD